jgi:hypothetical protein
MARPGKRARARTRAERLAHGAAASLRAWQAKNAADGGVCDFCANLLSDGPYVTWVTAPITATLPVIDLPRGRRSSESEIVIEDDSLWAACWRCDPVVAAADVERLIDHVLEARDVGRTGPITPALMPWVRADLRGLYTAFYAGGPRREADGV